MIGKQREAALKPLSVIASAADLACSQASCCTIASNCRWIHGSSCGRPMSCRCGAWGCR